MKKVVFFIESLEGGGAEKSLTELVENMDKSKFDITVVTESNDEVYTQRVQSACNLRYLVKKCSPERFFHYTLNRLIYRFINTVPQKILHKIIIGNRYDIEVACCEGFATKLIANSTNRSSKKIAFVHTDMQNNHWTTIHYESLEEELNCYKTFDSISCVSETVAQAFNATFGITDTVFVNHNPINAKMINEKAKEQVNLEPIYNLRLITAGRLTAVKAFDRLLRIAKRLKADGYHFQLLILGKGNKENELKEYIAENDLSDCIKLIGFQPNPYSFIAISDFFVCSSLAEGFSTVAVESIILGKPVVTTDCSGMTELFGGTECGIICENKEEALFASIKYVLDNPYCLIKYSSNCQKRADFFDIQKTVSDIEKMF